MIVSRIWVVGVPFFVLVDGVLVNLTEPVSIIPYQQSPEQSQALVSWLMCKA